MTRGKRDADVEERGRRGAEAAREADDVGDERAGAALQARGTRRRPSRRQGRPCGPWRSSRRPRGARSRRWRARRAGCCRQRSRRGPRRAPRRGRRPCRRGRASGRGGRPRGRAPGACRAREEREDAPHEADDGVRLVGRRGCRDDADDVRPAVERAGEAEVEREGREERGLGDCRPGRVAETPAKAKRRLMASSVTSRGLRARSGAMRAKPRVAHMSSWSAVEWRRLWKTKSSAPRRSAGRRRSAARRRRRAARRRSRVRRRLGVPDGDGDRPRRDERRRPGIGRRAAVDRKDDGGVRDRERDELPPRGERDGRDDRPLDADAGGALPRGKDKRVAARAKPQEAVGV